jgi:hypothetical protein
METKAIKKCLTKLKIEETILKIGAVWWFREQWSLIGNDTR